MSSPEEDQKPRRARFWAWVFFLLALMSFIGADKYKDFYYEISSLVQGNPINYAALAEFCGWTGQPLPGETDLEYRLRSFWNMLSAMMAMSSLAILVCGSIFGLIFGVFYLSGSFRDNPG